jgi:hypothetical protein
MEDAELQPPLVLYSGWKMQSYSLTLFSTVDGRCRDIATPCSLYTVDG